MNMADRTAQKSPAHASWQIVQNEFVPEENLRYESLFALGNGFIGTRGTFEEGLGQAGEASSEGTYLNGFFETGPIAYGEIAYGYPEHGRTMLNVTNGKVIALYLEDEPFNLLQGRIISFRRVLDLREGVLRRSVLWRSPGGKEIRLTAERLVSLARRNLMAIAYEVTPLNFAGVLRLVSALDADVANRTVQKDPRFGSGLVGRSLVVEERHSRDGVYGLKQRAKHSGLAMACAMTHRWDDTAGNGRFDPLERTAADRMEVSLEAPVEAGQPLRLTKYVAYVVSRDCAEDTLLPSAARFAVEAAAAGYDAVKTEHTETLARFWRRNEIYIDGDPAACQGVRFNIFHLFQAAGRDGATSIGAKGLSGEGYEGHYFWEAETYVLPFFLYSHPEIARRLLEYRYHTLDRARARAREMSHARGALYPWRTIDGDECSAYYPAGTAQYHINAGIALAVRKYVEATGDTGFLLGGGAEILFETARLWEDLGAYIPEKGGGFCLNEVTGPDEYTALVNNNYYTNLMAGENLAYASRIADWLRETHPLAYRSLAARIGLADGEVQGWRTAAASMYLPAASAGGVHPQDDTFFARAIWDFAGTPPERYPLLLHYHPLVIYRHQVCKQPDLVLALFLLGDRFTPAEKKRDFDYYEPITTHDSSLSWCIFSIVASELGYGQKAYDYFLRSARMDLDDRQGNTASGIHAANMAGSWLAVTHGFGGMRTYEGSLRFNPQLPRGWRGYGFRVTFRGTLLGIAVTADGVAYELLEGEELVFRHGETEVRLCREQPVRIMPLNQAPENLDRPPGPRFETTADE